MALYENGKRISGIRDFPAYTWAEYHALPVAKRPKVWKCTDRDYTEIPRESVSVTADGVKTYSQLLDALYALIDSTKITSASILRMVDSGKYFDFHLNFSTSSRYAFGYFIESGETSIRTMDIKPSSSLYKLCTITSSATHYEQSSTVPTAGISFTLYY